MDVVVLLVIVVGLECIATSHLLCPEDGESVVQSSEDVEAVAVENVAAEEAAVFVSLLLHVLPSLLDVLRDWYFLDVLVLGEIVVVAVVVAVTLLLDRFD